MTKGTTHQHIERNKDAAGLYADVYGLNQLTVACRCEKPEVIPGRVGENSPPANMRDLRFGMHRFPSVLLYCGQSGVDVVTLRWG